MEALLGTSIGVFVGLTVIIAGGATPLPYAAIAERAGIVVVAGMFVPADDGRVTNTLIATGPGVDGTTTRSTSATRSASPSRTRSHRAASL